MSIDLTAFEGTIDANVKGVIHQAFGRNYALWALDDAWEVIHTEGWSSADPPQLDAAELRENIIRSEFLSDGVYRLEVSLGFDSDLGWAAVVEYQTHDRELLERTGRLCQTAINAQRQIHRDRLTIDSLCDQVTNDFEEITLLRDIAEQLELTESSVPLADLAKVVFPILMRSFRAESIVMLSCTDGEPPLVVGCGGVEDAAYQRLVQEYGARAAKQPVVRNGVDESSDRSRYENLRDFVLVPISKNQEHYGWILAVNRQPSLTPLPWNDQTGRAEFGTNEAGLLTSLAAVLATQNANIKLFREKEDLLVSAVRTLVSAIEAKDTYTCGHSERVALYAERVARECGLEKEECERIYFSGLLHDIGKIGVQDETLTKTSRLTDEEFGKVKQHPELGGSILRDLDQLSYVLPGVVHHHERFDGKGYPDGLAGEEIPMSARILAVVDSYDAMTSDRPYRTGMDQEKAIGKLQHGAGTQWDAEIVAAFVQCLPDILEIKRSYGGPGAGANSATLPSTKRESFSS